MARADNNIKGRLAFITGASGGIGSAIARGLILQDVDLALHYTSNTLAIEDLVAQLRKDYETHVHPAEDRFLRITTHQADLSTVEGTSNLLDDVRKVQGRSVDIFVSNAGVAHFTKDISDISIEMFEDTININLRAAFVLTKGVVEGMKKQKWGRLIYVSSIAGYGAGVNGAHYAASKGGLTGMMKNLSTRLAEYGITANDVSPAMISSTGMFPGEATPEQNAAIPLGRMGTPEECANVVVMFATTGYMTGQSVLVAGGLNHK